MASAVLLACAIAFSEGALSGRRLGLAVQPPQRADVSMRSGRKSSRSKPVKQTRGGGEGFGSSTPPTTSSGQRTPAGVSDEPARERVTPSHDALLSSQLALNAAEHQRECEAGLAAWPSIATAAGATPVGTLPRSVRSDSLLSPNNEPFRTRDLVHITTAPVLAPDACAAIVAEAEATGNAHGWASRYTLQDSSRELHAAELPKSAALIAAALPGIAATAAAVLVPSLGPDGSHLRVYNALVVRYDACERRDSMAAHGDFSLLTINIALSDSHQGGGTWVQALGGEAGETVHAGPTGHAVIHAGGLWHAGARTTEGRRYILVLFLHSRLYIDHTAWLQTRAIAALRANDATAAVALLSLAIQLNPADAESWVQLATARRRSGDRPGALQAGRQAVALGEAAGDFSFDAVYNACCDARAEGLWAEAAAGFAEAARVAEASPEAAVPAEKQLAAELGLGACLRRLGLLEEAGEALERALGLDRDAADVWAELGLVMAQMGGGAAEAAAVVCQKNVARLMVAEKR